MSKPRISKAGKPRSVASKGGRPAKEGARYPSGKLRPPPPNPEVIARRLALCDDPTMATCPIDVMLGNGWITEDQHRTAAKYRHDRDVCGLGGPTVPTQRDLSTREGVDARGLTFAHMKDEEVSAIWDSAMATTPPPANDQDEGSRRAMQRYKEANRAMSPDQRNEVNAVVLLESWPQWVIQRRAGRSDTSWERKRDLLVAGLDAIERLYNRTKKAA